MFIAPIEQGRAFDELHDEVRLSRWRGSPVEETRDAGVFELRENLTLPPKTLIESFVAARAGDQLNGDAFAVFAVGSLGKIDDPHPAASDFVEDRIGADLRGARLEGFAPKCRSGQDGGVKLIGFALHREQRFHGGAKLCIGAAEPVEDLRTLRRLRSEDTGEDRFYLTPAAGRHARGVPSIFWSSQSRAMLHSRLTVAGEMPRTSAVSSMVRPPK